IEQCFFLLLRSLWNSATCNCYYTCLSNDGNRSCHWVCRIFPNVLPKFSYKTLVVFFATLTFVIANFGLTNIIKYAEPVLMFLYPLAIVLILLTFLSPLFHHARSVYVSTTIVTFLISIIDGFKTLTQTLEIDYFS